MSNTFERWGETLLGAAVTVVAVGFFAFAAAQAGQTGSAGGYDLVARFQRVDGVGVGSDVRVSGVKVGVVRAIELDPDTYMARLTMTVDRNVHVLDESTARIATDGLLGGAYVAIEPAGMDALPPGGEIPYTQGAVDLLTLLSSFAQGQGETEPSEAQTP
ncbi:MAG TPA: outer membrane lipid asymmetry maintenance protein MlaD [Vitreimonas sp.]|uniref:outer membrane lipid asymmetry maintenance protein MlaD n=1 Tax=Vitreimonas sp. TaxID=3069702 RepID=UPI002D4B7D9E|nr:outer membrane lipid asymmetry maintenance protein MlaD [Vitreimonas sp.]HYD88384.1 outer membrane lipid asymmetry maintenance protein MlaD [Vitreimonas sp.]